MTPHFSPRGRDVPGVGVPVRHQPEERQRGPGQRQLLPAEPSTGENERQLLPGDPGDRQHQHRQTPGPRGGGVLSFVENSYLFTRNSPKKLVKSLMSLRPTNSRMVKQ